MKKRFMAGIILVSMSLILALTFLIWAATSSQPQAEALAALDSDEFVKVDNRGYWVFTPVKTTTDLGFLFYPGAKVDPRSYAPMMHALAEVGITSVLVSMPFNLAFFAPMRAAEVMGTFPPTMKWVLGGHSLGGAMAAAFANKQGSRVKGLVFFAAYPPEGLDLTKSPLRVLSIYGEKDGVVTSDKIEHSKEMLPSNTVWVEIKGGNHSQFGWYGPQSGDNLAEISQKDQQSAVLGALIPFIKSVD